MTESSSLVRHRLLFVAPPREDHGPVRVGEIAEEPLHQNGLSHPRSAVHPDHRRLPARPRWRRCRPARFGADHDPPAQTGRGTRRATRGDRRSTCCRAGGGRRGSVGGKWAHAAGGPCKAWPDPRASPGRSARRWWVEALLVHHDLERAAQIRQAPSQGLVEHHPETVPVAGRPDRLARCLLGAM